MQIVGFLMRRLICCSPPPSKQKDQVSSKFAATKTVKFVEILLQRKTDKLAAIFVADCLFSPGFRAIENDIECRKQNFSIPSLIRVMDPRSLPAASVKQNVEEIFRFSLTESGIEKEIFNPTMTRVMDPKSLSAVKLKKKMRQRFYRFSLTVSAI